MNRMYILTIQLIYLVFILVQIYFMNFIVDDTVYFIVIILFIILMQLI